MDSLIKMTNLCKENLTISYLWNKQRYSRNAVILGLQLYLN